MRTFPPRPTWIAAAVLVLGGCGTTAPRSAPPSAAALLAEARSTLDATHAVHFTLTGAHVPAQGTQIEGGSGDLVRPNSLQATFEVSASGIPASVKVISIGSAFYAELPFSSSYGKVNPAQFGLGNPAQLLDPTTGVSGLLTDAAAGAVARGQRRIGGEVLDVVTGTVPGSKVPVLPDANRSVPVQLTALIDPSTRQLREVTLTGPLAAASVTTTYTVILTKYGENVTVALPPG